MKTDGIDGRDNADAKVRRLQTIVAAIVAFTLGAFAAQLQ